MIKIEDIIIIKWLGNQIGKYLHYEACPNCGDSWWWKSSGGINYKSNGNTLYEIMICKECLRNPEGLDLSKIEKDLSESQWDSGDIRLAKMAITSFKERKTNLQS